jgi:hypothetical protein
VNQWICVLNSNFSCLSGSADRWITRSPVLHGRSPDRPGPCSATRTVGVPSTNRRRFCLSQSMFHAPFKRTFVTELSLCGAARSPACRIDATSPAAFSVTQSVHSQSLGRTASPVGDAVADGRTSYTRTRAGTVRKHDGALAAVPAIVCDGTLPIRAKTRIAGDPAGTLTSPQQPLPSHQRIKHNQRIHVSCSCHGQVLILLARRRRTA